MYTWEGMEKVSYDEAKDYFFKYGGYSGLYLLYDDNTECEAISLEDIENHHSYCGEYGFEKQ